MLLGCRMELKLMAEITQDCGWSISLSSLFLLVKQQQVGWWELTLSRNKPERGRGLREEPRPFAAAACSGLEACTAGAASQLPDQHTWRKEPRTALRPCPPWGVLPYQGKVKVWGEAPGGAKQARSSAALPFRRDLGAFILKWRCVRSPCRCMCLSEMVNTWKNWRAAVWCW